MKLDNYDLFVQYKENLDRLHGLIREHYRLGCALEIDKDILNREVWSKNAAVQAAKNYGEE